MTQQIPQTGDWRRVGAGDVGRSGGRRLSTGGICGPLAALQLCILVHYVNPAQLASYCFRLREVVRSDLQPEGGGEEKKECESMRREMEEDFPVKHWESGGSFFLRRKCNVE